MIPKECKRLAEVDFPIAVVSKHAAREKTVRHGHPSTLHLWWARRPLAACRAMLMALLLPDPYDPRCPAEFKKKARQLLLKTRGSIDSDDVGLRQAILRFVGDCASWDLASDALYMEVARGLVQAAHPEETPLIVDPFAGGGAIPLEAVRMGCDAFASDLNPVACLILKVMLENIARHGPGLGDELRDVGARMKQETGTELALLYPLDPDGARPITYLWARTVRCESPNCGAEIPLVRSFWLCKKASRKRALRYKVVRPKGHPPRLEFEIFEPNNNGEVPRSTVTRAKATCPCCAERGQMSVLSPDRVRIQQTAQRGGADVIFDEDGQRGGGAMLLAVVVLKSGEHGRRYRLPTRRNYEAVFKAQEQLKELATKTTDGGLNPTPDEPTPKGGGSGAGRAFSVQKYGMMQWSNLFTARQNLALVEFARHLATLQSDSFSETLSLALSKLSELACSLCAWEPDAECPRHVFGRQTLQITWDFAEGVLTSESSGSFEVCLDNLINGVASVGAFPSSVSPSLADACEHPLPDDSATVWFTDPPYYDAVPYSDLSDSFLVWLKRCLPRSNGLRDPFDPANPLSPKAQEAVQDESRMVEGRAKDRGFFEETMARAFSEGQRVTRPDGIGCVVFAHKTTEGWEALLSGMI